MKVEFWVIGNTSFDYLKEGTAIYEKRLKHYLPFEYKVIPDIKQAKNLSSEQLKEKEGLVLLQKLNKGDYLILMDENGKEMSSVKFASYLENLLQQSYKKLIFVVGGAYGFSPAVYQRANAKLSLSKMTFSHQMIRVFALEQLYRAMSILRNQPYHHR
jgi:23S rRNA (pseudouridine1915-N3)-methyltransferase